MPIQLPIGSEDTFKGIIDLVEMDADIYYDELGKDMRVEPIPADMVDLANEYREKLLDAVSMFDDEIMEMYLEGEEIPRTDIRTAIRKATIANEMVPVTCGTSYTQQGRSEAAGRHRGLHALSHWTCPPSRAPTPRPTRRRTVIADDDAPFSALAFKIMTDPYVGRLSFFRVYSGHLTTGSSVLNSTKNAEGAHRPHPADARQPPGGHRGGLLRRYRRRRGPEEHHHRRHPVRREGTPSFWSPWSSPSP